MDNTLCDMFSQLIEYGYESKELYAYSKVEAKAIKKAIFTYEFFVNMQPTPLVSFLKKLLQDNENVRILTALPDVNVEAVKRAKHDWVKKHIGDIEIIFTDSQEEKADHCKLDNHVLIDDNFKALKPWLEAGGIVIKVSDEFEMLEL